jgi:hypothetical protein
MEDNYMEQCRRNFEAIFGWSLYKKEHNHREIENNCRGFCFTVVDNYLEFTRLY